MRRLCLMMALALLLAACNLQQQPPLSPTADDALTTPQQAATTTPPQAVTALPTLRPTPTQLTLVTVTQPAAPTPLDFNTGAGQPTLDAALADERYEIQVRSGAAIGVNYEVTIGTHGTVSMTLQGPDGVVWQQAFTASESGRKEVQIEQGGTYEVLVDRENLDGSYSVSWD
ncbi:MAG: hypothetical protein K8J31_10245 [Anaerolineae bacterium]|nr:hypothetical protein [Anaerolineae bacterium]